MDGKERGVFGRDVVGEPVAAMPPGRPIDPEAFDLETVNRRLAGMR